MADLPNNKDVTYFAETDFRGQRTPFGIKSKDRARHFYVIGKTGMGKSTLLENMAIQDIRNGNGLGYLDPHGSTAEKLLDFVPEERIKDVLYFAPFDLEHPVSFNIMEDVGKDKRHLVANGLIASFKKIWPDVWSARMEYILNNTVLALLEYPNSTLLGVNRMLSDKNYRKKVVDNISDPSVKSFWIDEFAKYNERYMQEAGDAIKNKIGQFTSNPLIRNIIGQPKSSFDIRELMDGKKILIANLSKGRVGEQNANLLGGMLMTKIYLSAMSRADMSDAEMRDTPPFYLFVDEFQSFVNDSFKDILSEARKYKLNLTIAHQYIDQMPEEVRSAVFGNVGTTVVFRVGPFDAEVLETVFMPKFTKEDLVNLGFAQVYLTLMIDGVGSPPFSAVTLAPLVNIFPSLKDKIIDSSRLQFAHPRTEVEEAISHWHDEQRMETEAESRMAARRSAVQFGSGERRSPPSAQATSAPPSRINIPESIRQAVAEAQSASSEPLPHPIKEAKPPIAAAQVRPSPTSVPVSPAVAEKPKIEKPAEDSKNSLKAALATAIPEHRKLPLSALAQPRYRGGSSANKDELRAALSGLIPKTEPEKKEPRKPEPDQAPKSPSSETPSSGQDKNEKKPGVPEDVLRKMLEL
jgi:hypothetical protein